MATMATIATSTTAMISSHDTSRSSGVGSKPQQHLKIDFSSFYINNKSAANLAASDAIIVSPRPTTATAATAAAAATATTTKNTRDKMPNITKSPYDGQRCAESDEACFEELYDVFYHGENARHLLNARLEILESGIIFSVNWLGGRIRGRDFGSIPKRDLLLCLYGERFSKGDTNVLGSIVSSLDCFELVIEALETWGFEENYLSLASNKNNKEKAFIFDTQKRNCFKCQIFVARAFAAYQVFNRTKSFGSSFESKIKMYLDFMDKNVRVGVVYQIELDRLQQEQRSVMDKSNVVVTNAGLKTTDLDDGSDICSSVSKNLNKTKQQSQKKSIFIPKQLDMDARKDLIGRRIGKDFNGEIYFGTLDKFCPKNKFYHVLYDDGDSEEFLREGIDHLLSHYETIKSSDVSRQKNTPSSRTSKCKRENSSRHSASRRSQKKARTGDVAAGVNLMDIKRIRVVVDGVIDSLLPFNLIHRKHSLTKHSDKRKIIDDLSTEETNEDIMTDESNGIWTKPKKKERRSESERVISESKQARYFQKFRRQLNVSRSRHFPRELYNMLEDSEQKGYADFIHWLPSGDSFVIPKVHLSANRILRRRCIRKRWWMIFSSFEDSLIYFGFEKIVGNDTEGSYRYRHPHFVRGQVKRLDFVNPVQKNQYVTKSARKKFNSANTITAVNDTSSTSRKVRISLPSEAIIQSLEREDLDVPQTRINATSSATTNKDDGDKNHMSIATDDFSLYLLPQSIVIDDVNDHDVLMGPRKCKKHPGNKVYRDIVRKYRPQLEAIGDRALVANMVIDHIHYQIGGRFLKADSTNQWHVVPRLDVITKIKKALVGLRTPSIGGPALPNSVSTITMLESVGQSIVEQDNKRPKRKSACREVIDDDNDEDRAELTKLQISPQSMADGLSQNDNDVPHPIVNPQCNGEDNSGERGEDTSVGRDVIDLLDDDNDEDRAELTKLQVSPQSKADRTAQIGTVTSHPIVNSQRNGEDNSDKRGEATSAGHDVIDLLDDDKDEDQVELTKLQISLQSKADETAQKRIVTSHPVTEIKSKTAMNNDDVERRNFPNGSITDKSKNRHDDDPSPSIIDLLNEEKGEEHEKESEDTLKPRASDHQQVGEEEETIEDNDDIIVIGSSSAPIDIDDLLEVEERNEERFDPLEEDDDIQITGSTGKNALSDYPHPRHECVVKSFTKNPEHFCPNCYCFVCDIKASECAEWKDCHCKADSDIKWRLQRRKIRNKRKAPERARQRLAISFLDYDTDQDLSLATTSQRRTRRTRSNVSITTLPRGSSQKDVQGVHFMHNT